MLDRKIFSVSFYFFLSYQMGHIKANFSDMGYTFYHCSITNLVTLVKPIWLQNLESPFDTKSNAHAHWNFAQGFYPHFVLQIPDVLQF